MTYVHVAITGCCSFGAYISDYFTKTRYLYPLNASICAKAHCNGSILIHNLSVSILCIYVNLVTNLLRPVYTDTFSQLISSADLQGHNG